MGLYGMRAKIHIGSVFNCLFDCGCAGLYTCNACDMSMCGYDNFGTYDKPYHAECAQPIPAVRIADGRICELLKDGRLRPLGKPYEDAPRGELCEPVAAETYTVIRGSVINNG